MNPSESQNRTPKEVLQQSGHALLVAINAVEVLATEDRREVTTDELQVIWQGEGQALLVELAYSVSDRPRVTFFRTFSDVLETGKPYEVFTTEHLGTMTSLAVNPETNEPFKAVPFDGQRTVHLRIVVETPGAGERTVFKLVARVSPASPRFRVEPSWAATSGNSDEKRNG